MKTKLHSSSSHYLSRLTCGILALCGLAQAAEIEVSSFYGTADGKERISAIGSDAAGNIYLAGVRTGPYSGPYTPYAGITNDVFLVKLNPAGNQVLYSRTIGGMNGDVLAGMVVDPSGAVTLAGTTFSPDFPQTGTPQTFRGMGSGDSAPYVISEGFVTRIAANGDVVYSRLISGASNEAVRSIDAYGSGSVLIATMTASSDLPVTGGQRVKAGTAAEGHLLVIDPTGAVVRGSYVRTSDASDAGFKAKADNAGNVYVAGQTTLTAVKSPVGFQQGIGSSDDLFKLSADWQTVIYHCGVGGANALAVDRVNGLAYTFSNGTNDTHPWSSSPSTNGAFQSGFPGGGTSINITKVKADGTGREYATWYGGSNHTNYFPSGATVDSQGRLAFIMGALAHDLPTVNGLVAPHRDSAVSPAQYGSAYYCIMAANGLSVTQASFLENDQSDGSAIGLTDDGKLLVAGTTNGTSSLTLVNPMQTTPAGNGDSFFMRLNLTTALPLVSAAFTSSSVNEGTIATLRVSRTGSTTGSLAVHLAYNGDASAALDMTAPPASVTIPAGSASVDIPIAITNDGVKEANEVFNATLTRGGLTYNIAAPGSGSTRAAMATTTIVDVNGTGKIGVWAIADSDVSALEGSTGTIKFQRSGSLTNPLDVPVTYGGTAINGTGGDYTALANVHFGPGGAYGFIYVNTIDDSAVEGDETVTVAIAANPDAVLVGPAPILTILDGDVSPSLPYVSIASSDATGDVRTGDPTSFTIGRTGSTATPLSVSISLSGTATMGADFTAIPATVVIPAGQAATTVTITPINDSPSEGNEDITVTLDDNPTVYNLPGIAVQGQPTPPVIGPRSVSLTLLDDAFVGVPDPVPTDPSINVLRGVAAIADGGTDVVGSTTTLTYAIENQGGALLNLGGVPATLSGTNCTATISPNGAIVVNGGGNATLVVVITPSGGTWSLPISFTTNDPLIGTFNWTISSVAVNGPGDLNGDKVVNVSDLTLVTSNFGKTTGSPGFNPLADSNSDGVVNVTDLSAVTSNFGKTYP